MCELQLTLTEESVRLAARTGVDCFRQLAYSYVKVRSQVLLESYYFKNIL